MSAKLTEKQREYLLELAICCWDNEWCRNPSDIEKFFMCIEAVIDQFAAERALEEAKWWMVQMALRNEHFDLWAEESQRIATLAAQAQKGTGG